jgi:hypothetical protein
MTLGSLSESIWARDCSMGGLAPDHGFKHEACQQTQPRVFAAVRRREREALVAARGNVGVVTGTFYISSGCCRMALMVRGQFDLCAVAGLHSVLR